MNTARRRRPRRGNDGEAKAHFCASALAASRNVPWRLWPNLKVVAGDDMMRTPQPFDQIVLDEIAWRIAARNASIKALRDHEIDAERRNRLGLGAKRRQAKRRGVRLKNTAGVRLERQNAPRVPARFRQLTGLADHRLVPHVHAVEIADRDHGAPV